MTRWIDPLPVSVPDSFASLDLPVLVSETLVRRGIADLHSARRFLHPEEAPPNPFPQIEPAVDLIHLAIRKREKICVWGDFDVDGQTSTALLVETLRALGADVMYYVPVRSRESHGVHVSSLKPLIEAGAKLLLTCDTGITAHEALDYARLCGLEVIITDHHDPGETLPLADAVVNPKLLAADHPLAHLAGVGVAYKLAEALTTAAQHSGVGDLLDLVALGLIGDVALLRDETRSLARAGIQAFRDTSRLGLRTIAALSETNLETLTEETIGFVFAPRLNALGRLGDANPAVELLLTHDPVRARVLATQIEGLNAQRRLLTSQVYEGAEAQLQADRRLLDEPAIVLYHAHWPGGVIGIVAGRLAERYHKPAILLSAAEGGMLRGSARSVEGLHITRAIASQKDLLLGFGGHPMAAGLSLQMDRLAEFRRGLGRAVEAQLGEAALEEPSMQIDAWLGLDQISLELAEALDSLAPFGAGNPALTFATPRVRLKSASEIGRTREHLRMIVEDEAGRTQQVMWWGGTGEELPPQGNRFDLAFSLRASTFRGQREASVRFAEFRVAEEERPVEIAPREIHVTDLRAVPQPARRLLELKLECPEAQTWAEGSERLVGRPGYELEPAEALIIYTIPASAADLRRAMDAACPRTVYLFAVPCADEKAGYFLERLAGLCKYAINQRGGKVSVRQLAALTGQRRATVQHGLEWLRAGGHIAFEGDEDLEISGGGLAPEPDLQREFYGTVQSLLDETAAYRRYYAAAPDPAALLQT
ncbi:MAG: single-stranded-DNA-specific exonuclease RecJ [Bacteroidota bacterium]